MKNAASILGTLLLAAVVLASGCVSGPAGTVQQSQQSQDVNEQGGLSGSTIADPYAGLTRLADNYYRYDPDAYQAALSEGKVVFLDFHADWCPICNAEKPDILAAFNEAGYEDVAGFEVHYNDAQTNDHDRELIQQFQVPYQHTKVVLDKSGNVVLKSLEVMDKADVLDILGRAREA